MNGTVLAFDYGDKRIGVAMGEWELKLAHPLTTIQAGSKEARFQAIDALVKEWQPERLVVGLPLHMDGSEHKMTVRCRQFAQQLAGRFKIAVDLMDERLSSAEAEDLLAGFGRGGQKNKHLIDTLAAQRILQSYFDQHATA